MKLKIGILFLAFLFVILNGSEQTTVFANEAEIPETITQSEDSIGIYFKDDFGTYGLLRYYTTKDIKVDVWLDIPGAIYHRESVPGAGMYHGWLGYLESKGQSIYRYEGYMYPDDGTPLPQPTKIEEEEK